MSHIEGIRVKKTFWLNRQRNLLENILGWSPEEEERVKIKKNQKRQKKKKKADQLTIIKKE